MAQRRKPVVLVYRDRLLPRSETFIKEQILAYRKWRGILIGRRSLSELSLEGLDVRLLRPVVRSDLLSRVWWRISRGLDSLPFPIVAQLRREEPSLLHAHFGVDAIHAWPIARALDLPMVVTLHGYDINIHREWWEAGHWGGWFRHYPRRLLELAALPRVHFIAVSEAIRRKAIDFGIPADKVSLQYIGIDIRRFTPGGPQITHRERRVLFVGRLVEKKGCEFLIRAFAEVRKIVSDASLVVVGEGDLHRPLEELARQLGIQVEFLGALTSAEIRHELSLARVFCLPSVTAENGDAEGFGLVLLEAQASGVPVVTSARGGSAEGVHDGIGGLIFPERDIAMLATQLIRLLTDDGCATSMALAGPIFAAENFDAERCTQSLERLYDEFSRTSESLDRVGDRESVVNTHTDNKNSRRINGDSSADIGQGS
jgi:glycosyltransferase involved in cell wall biosynthesis